MPSRGRRRPPARLRRRFEPPGNRGFWSGCHICLPGSDIRIEGLKHGERRQLLMMIIRAAQLPGTGTALGGAPERMPDADPLQSQAAQAFAVELAAGCVPSVRTIRARLHVGLPRAQRVRAYLAALNDTQAGAPLEHRAAISEVRSAA